MEKSKNIIICIVEPFTDVAIGLVDSLEKISYSDERGFGFENFIRVSEQVSATLINRTSTYINEYDFYRKEFQKRQIYLYSEINFSIDKNTHTLIVHGNIASLNQLKDIFDEISKQNLKILPLKDLTPVNLYQKLVSKNSIFTVDELAVNRFIYNNGIVGRFSGKVLKQRIVDDLFNKYATDIIRMLVTVTIAEDEEFSVQVSLNGSLKIIGEEYDLEYYLDFLKKLILN